MIGYNLVKLKWSPYVISKFHRRSEARFYKIFVEILCKHKFATRQHFSDNSVGHISKTFSRYTFQLIKLKECAQWKMIIQCTNGENTKIAIDLCRFQAWLTAIYFYMTFLHTLCILFCLSAVQSWKLFMIRRKNDTILTSSILDTFQYFDSNAYGAKK